MADKASLVIVPGDDWKGLYADGWLLMQGHSLDAADVLEMVAELDKPFTLETKWPDEDWLSEGGWLPEQLDAVKFAEN